MRKKCLFIEKSLYLCKKDGFSLTLLCTRGEASVMKNRIEWQMLMT